MGDHDDVDAAAPGDLHGRSARPSAYAQHCWQGFSTGEWDGDMLKVTTTHLKEGWLRRNGVPRSEKATLDRVLHPARRLPDARHHREGSRVPHRGVRPHVELGGRSGISAEPVLVHPDARDRARARAKCRIICPARTRTSLSLRTRHGLPSEAARGGAETMYPDYLTQLHAAGVR